MTRDPPIDALKAIAHPVRLKLLQALVGKEASVGEIEVASEIAQPALSQQLAVLRNAGLVKTRKEAKLVFYRIDSESFKAIASVIEGLAAAGTGPIKESRAAAKGVANFAQIH